METIRSTIQTPENDISEALLMLSEVSEVQRKRSRESEQSGDELPAGSSDEESAKKQKTQSGFVRATIVPSWMDRYNSMRQSLNAASHPSSSDVQWLNEQLVNMRNGGLSPERTELLKQAVSLIAVPKTLTPTRVAATTVPSSPETSCPGSPASPVLKNTSSKKMKRNQLSSWMCTQRQDRKSQELPEYRIRLLDLVGFVWSKQLKNKSAAVIATDATQIEEEILSSAEVNVLSGRAKRNHELWLVRYHELSSFKKTHGHLKVPTLIADV